MATSQVSKIMIRSGSSSIRALIHRHLRPTVTASTTAVANLQTGTTYNTYNWHYLFPHTLSPCSVRDTVSNGAAGCLVLDEAALARRKSEEVVTQSFDDDNMSDYEDDDSEMSDLDFVPPNLNEDEDDDDDDDDDSEDLEK